MGHVSVPTMGEDEIDFRPDVNETDLDRVVSASALVASAFPMVGSVVAEAIKLAIPNQRLDRIAQMLTILDGQLQGLSRDFVEQRMRTKEFRDLLEDGLIQSTRALTKERREYIASLLKNSITDEERSHERDKTLLSLLGQLNDSELIILGWFGCGPVGEQAAEYRKRHVGVLAPAIMETGMTDEEEVAATMQEAYINTLDRLNLASAGTVTAGRLRPLGRALLRRIDFFSIQGCEEPS